MTSKELRVKYKEYCDQQKDCDSCIYGKEFWCGLKFAYNRGVDDFVKTLIPRLADAIYSKDVPGMVNLINEIVREVKGEEE